MVAVLLHAGEEQAGREGWGGSGRRVWGGWQVGGGRSENVIASGSVVIVTSNGAQHGGWWGRQGRSMVSQSQEV